MWCPDWPIGRPDAPSDRTVIVVGPPEGGVARVVGGSPAAHAAGVTLGMPRREAEGLCPDSVVLDRDLGEETRRFEPVVALLGGLIPRVEVSEPGLVFIPLAGAIRYYGGEEAIVDLISGKLWAEGVEHRIGVADGPFAALWAARSADDAPMIVTDTMAFLSDLDVGALGHEDIIATFRWLGVHTLGSLAGLPRDAIASRFGDAGLQAHRLAHGEDRMVDPRPIPAGAAVEAVYEEPLESIDQVAFAARSLAARLIERLRPQGIAAHRVEVVMEGTDGVIRRRVWRSADPFTESALSDRVWWQLRAWMDGDRRARRGITRLRLDPSDISGDGRQLSFLVDETSRAEAERALARAQTLVGPDSVLQAAPQGGRMPAETVAWHRWGDPANVTLPLSAPWPGATPAPTPALVPPRPPLLQVEWDDVIPVRVRLRSRWEPVLTWSGPWRTSGRWWRGEASFDRYQLVTSAGAFLCIRSEDGSTYLAGVYD